MSRLSFPLWCCAVLVYVFLYAPLVVVMVYSFQHRQARWPLAGFYHRLVCEAAQCGCGSLRPLRRRQERRPGKTPGTQKHADTGHGQCHSGNGIRHAAGLRSAALSVPGKTLCAWLLYFPVVVPEIVMAVALLLFFALLREWSVWLLARLGYAWPELFTLGMSTMILAHITFQIPFVAIVVRARLTGLDPAIEEAARDLGASTWQTFWRVTLPLMLPGVLAGGLLAFTLSLDDFVVSFFTTGPGATTLPILIYSSVRRGITPDINALSTLLVVASIIGTLGITLLQRPRQSL